MKILRQIWSRLLTFVSNLSRAADRLATILTILAALGLGSAGFGFISHTLPEIFIGIAIVLFSVILFILFYTLLETKVQALPEQAEQANVNLVATDTKVYPEPSKDDDVELLLKEIVYEYAADGLTMRQRKRLHMRMLRNGITHFTDRYNWTGNGTCSIRSLTPGFSVNNQRKIESWNYFDITFPHPLPVGADVDFAIEWEMFDERGEAVPFLSTMIDRETKHLLLRVILPHELAPRRAYCYEFANYIDTLPKSAQELHWSPATQSLSYDVPNPKKYHKYSIRWHRE